MRIKFQLERMAHINNLTSGKRYLVKGKHSNGTLMIEDDAGRTIHVNSIGLKSAHLQYRTSWEVVGE